ncbi:MAG: formyltransferase family protein [Pseudomonadota bacterium]
MECLLLLSHGMLAAPLSDALRRYNPSLLIVCAADGEQLRNAFETTAGRFDRLIAFCTETIVSATQLAALGGPAYNFHPAPPGYPGSHPASFALYDGVTRFGATVHEMAVRVDSGPIVDVEWFDVEPETGIFALEDKAGEGRCPAILAARPGARALRHAIAAGHRPMGAAQDHQEGFPGDGRHRSLDQRRGIRAPMGAPSRSGTRRSCSSSCMAVTSPWPNQSRQPPPNRARSARAPSVRHAPIKSNRGPIREFSLKTNTIQSQTA